MTAVAEPDQLYATPARWRVATALALSLIGLGISIYLTIDHFAKIPLACSDQGLINCQKVTTSAQSYFLGIPVAVLGLVFYTAMTVVNLPMLWFAADRRIHMVRLAMATVGVLFALYLVSAELLIIGNICLWCTSVHVITFILFVVVVATVPAMLGWGGNRYGDDGYDDDEED
ncbi:MAG TPA: vitamin K epoxide reductase family protein [Acidimicrobiales bacterium]|nr:vitamin K epoxide reductase family protein [Acidimicrobiales bacterium]